MKLLPLYLLAILYSFIAPLTAAEFRAGDVRITEPWARATPGASKTAAAYLTLRNTGRRGDRLIGIDTPVARRASLHGVRMKGNMMQMFAVKSLALGPGETVKLSPGGTHVMLVGMKRPLKKGDMFAMTLRFAEAGSVEIRVMVAGIGAMAPMGHTGMKH